MEFDSPDVGVVIVLVCRAADNSLPEVGLHEVGQVATLSTGEVVEYEVTGESPGGTTTNGGSTDNEAQGFLDKATGESLCLRCTQVVLGVLVLITPGDVCVITLDEASSVSDTTNNITSEFNSTCNFGTQVLN